MERILNRNAYRLLFGIFSIGLAFSFFSCDDEDEKMESVDLRYNPKDSYTITAASPEKVVFEVKSDHPWKVYGKADWYTITPANGGPDSIYTVTVACQENTNLDDRTDTLFIQSDYWIGKQFELIQKGTAWLETNEDTIPIIQAGGNIHFSITSNQNWSCEVTQGEDWLTLTGIASGSINGDISATVTENKGESRYGVITVFDRHHVKAQEVVISQAGVLLVPAVTEIRQNYFEEDISFTVESNASWKISKSEFDVWYEFVSGEEYESGTSTVTLHLQANMGVSLRRSEITFTSVSDDPAATPVVKTVVLKQSPVPNPELTEFNGHIFGGSTNGGAPQFTDGDMVIPAGIASREVFSPKNTLGTHYFRIKEMAANSYPVIYFVFNWAPEFRCHIKPSTGMTDASSTSVELLSQSGQNIPLDITQPHILGVTLSDAGGEYAGKMKVEMTLDYGKPFMTYICNNVTNSPGNTTIYVGGMNGYCVWDWYGFEPLVNWE